MEIPKDKVILSCALTGVLTDPNKYPVPLTPSEMADAALEAYNAGASIVHCHFRNQEPGKGALATWDSQTALEICQAIRDKVPKILINMSTGVVGDEIDEPLQCLREVRPELAALNAGSLNYLKLKSDGSWAWPPILFKNPVEKIQTFLSEMKRNKIFPECECFDTGIVRSVGLFKDNGMLPQNFSLSLVMGVASGMPAKASWLPLLIEEIPDGIPWQTIAIVRQEVWEVHRRCCELGGQMRSGLEDTFYLPNGEKTNSNGKLIEALAQIATEVGRNIASPDETRAMYRLQTAV